MSASAPVRLIEFRNTTLGATVAVLQATEPPALADALHKMLGGMPDFFNGEALILDFSLLGDTTANIDWAGLNSLLRRYRLQPIGVLGMPPAHAEGARRAGLAELDAAVMHDRPAVQAPVVPAPAPAQQSTPTPAPTPAVTQAAAATAAAPVAASVAASPSSGAAAALPTLFVDRPLRSGQQVYARGTDVVLLGGVSPGAEIIADGSIHCYGPLRGRAIAGAQGDDSARIIASNFGPELVSIAGVFRTFESGIPATVAGRAAQVRLSGAESTLNIEPLQLD